MEYPDNKNQEYQMQYNLPNSAIIDLSIRSVRAPNTNN